MVNRKSLGSNFNYERIFTIYFKFLPNEQYIVKNVNYDFLYCDTKSKNKMKVQSKFSNCLTSAIYFN